MSRNEDVAADLRRTVRDLLTAHGSSAAVRAAAETPDGTDRGLWRRISSELGLTGLGVPEEFGGAGYGDDLQPVVFEELGAALAPVPHLATVGLAMSALLASGDADAQKRHCPDLVAGTAATLAFTEADRNWDVPSLATSAELTPHGDAWLLTGRKTLVLDGPAAELILVLAQAPEGPTLFAVAGDEASLRREGVRGLDLTRRFADVVLEATPAVAVGGLGDGRRIVEAALVRATAFLAAEQLGGMQRCLDSAVDYAKLRHQFGRPIGSFQAVKHKCADMLVDVESARSLVEHLGTVLADRTDLALPAATAAAFCADAYRRVAAESLHVHGGIGFTWEHDAHLYVRRAEVSALLFGDASYQRRRVAELLAL
ncbi:MAG TPA: acyl-CoA dehydrogenase family protein [Sporichthya sp.]|nr:acyl-CoA dehydrogenase family protein [Sporichthya sp.]